MSEKKLVSICPTGHEGWFKHLAHFFGSDISNPVTHRFTDPITKERVESNTSFPGKSIVASAVVKVLGQVDREGNCFKKVLFDSPYLFNSGVDVTPDEDGVYRLNVGSFGIENAAGNTYVMDGPLGVGSFSMRTPLTRKRILAGYREKMENSETPSRFFTELDHPLRKV